MKNISTICAVLLFAVYSGLSAQVSFGKPEKINEKWEFHLGDSLSEQTRWRTLNLPHDWSVEGALNPSLAACTGYLPGGIGWYRKSLDIPADKKGEKVFIYFEGVQNRSEVYLNGHLLGKRPNGYVSFLYDMTPYISFGGENVLTVRVDHSRYADSRWYNGSGIYRNVWLVFSNPVHIAQWGVYAQTKKATVNSAELAVETEIANETESPAAITVTNELFDAEGKKIASASQKISLKAKSANQKVEQTLKISRPSLWSLDSPALYTLKTTVAQNGIIIDETTTQTGIRTLAFSPDNGLALNGKYLKVKGLCIHHDAGVLGAAVPREIWERRLQTLKSLGCNAIRLTHNLHNPDVYDICDELGLLVMDEVFDEWEFPKRKWIEGWNIGNPGYDGGADYFNEWSGRDLGDGVRRDRNHPSVFAWSIGNEVDYPNDPYSHPILDSGGKGFTQAQFGGYKKDAPDANRLGGIAKRLVAVVKQFDRSRPVTAGLAGVAMSNETDYPYLLDIVGYNYTENRYEEDHNTYPERIIYGSENRHDMEAWKAVRDNQFIFGQFLWTGIDYLGESGVWPSRGFYSGLLDFAGFIKPRGNFRKALWSDEPTAYLGTYLPFGGFRRQMPSMDAWPVWNYEDGQTVKVVCYTNAPKAQLFLNNEPVGDVKNYDDNTGIILWDVPYKAGKLLVKGYDSAGKEICQTAIQTSEQPQKLALKAYQTEISSKRGVAQIEIQALDRNGVPAVLADNLLTCRIDGPGKLLGLEAGDNTDMGNYRDNSQRIFRGRMIAYVEAAGKPGEKFKVSFTSPWLEKAEIEIGIK
ncbi:MAG: DUF4982 domain-containing protein [Dysgonamonadaceae bacterium]|jgi:beta-galactosidase/beta-glucuronidase|nr:DUF4982 domain-containing protein [Dysgonamonadaceae bacterium]